VVVVHRVVGEVSQDEHDARESVVSEVCRLHFVCVFGIEGEVIFGKRLSTAGGRLSACDPGCSSHSVTVLLMSFQAFWFSGVGCNWVVRAFVHC
jgi:hypothetical protein